MRTGMRGGMHSGDDPTHGFPARIAGLGRGTTLTHGFRAAAATLRLDPGQLPIRDRAVLRILNRARLANAEQLGILVYRNRHYAQIRLRRLWELGYLERSGLPPPTGIGGSPYVYRLAPAAMAHLGYAPRPWRGPGYIAHTLHAVEAVCTLVRSTDPEDSPTVLRWLPESIVVDVLPAGPVAGAVLAIAADEGPATQLLVPNLMVASAMLNALWQVVERGSVPYSDIYLDVTQRAARPRRWFRLRPGEQSGG